MLKEIIQSADTALVDVRSPMEYEMGHVEGSINIPMNEVVDRLEELRGMQPMVVFCQSGNRSAQVLQYLEAQGFDKVWNGGGWLSVDGLKRS
jgi:phage shock protein E